ncbi:MAG: DNA-protecting protein DprA [Coriobacteriia bacterium]|nr:DNA-protecting protein DprA [Coriobacteriia bacterium]
MKTLRSDAERFELRLKTPGYPDQLAMAPDPPAILYGIGDPAALIPGLAVIGARKATPYGLHAAQILTGWAARAGYTIISGAAIGCDQAAHRAALEAGAPTVAVLGCGADLVYPSAAGELLAAIAQSGAVVSEHPWGTTPQRWTFRTRNRIIAGLSAALLVLEAGLPSGTFSTADYALAAGRDVFVVPGSIFAPECRGANRLISQGATPIADTDDLARALRGVLPEPHTALLPDWTLDGMGSTDDPFLAALRTNHCRIDDLARDLGTDVVTAARRVGVLETEGLVVRFGDGRYGAVSR